MPDKAELIVDDRKIQVSNLDKVLYPKVGFTKRQVIDYYIRVAPVLLPHLKDRPLTLKRYPDGVEGEFFYEKNCPSHRPKWVKTAKVWSEGNNRMMNYCLAQDLPTLVWAANLADLELHTSLPRKNSIKTILSHRTCRKRYAKEKCSLIGVRTTNTKPRSVSIRVAPGKSQPFRPLSHGMKWKTA